MDYASRLRGNSPRLHLLDVAFSLGVPFNSVVSLDPTLFLRPLASLSVESLDLTPLLRPLVSLLFRWSLLIRRRFFAPLRPYYFGGAIS
jgi:hypothetical protein